MNNLREIRIKKNLTQQELARKIGVTQRCIAFIEKGDRTPSLENACKMAFILKTSVEKIFLPTKCTFSTIKANQDS